MSLGRQRSGDLFAPPQPGLASVAITEADQTSARVERAERPEARVACVPLHRVAEADHPTASSGEAQSAAEDPQEVRQQAAADLVGGQRPHGKPHNAIVVAPLLSGGLLDLGHAGYFGHSGGEALEAEAVVDRVDPNGVALGEL